MEWYINKGAKNCINCDRFFKEEEEYFSALYDMDKDYARRDFCLDCWNRINLGEVFSYWKTRVQKPSDTEKKYVDIGVFYNLFLRLENESNFSSVNFRYVLSLYLMRKKILKLKTTDRINGNEILIFHDFNENKETKVFKPHLGREEILAVTEEIGKLLNCTSQI